MDPVVVGIAGLSGLIFGSFANVVVHRVPRGESVVRPGSACPSCGEAIRARDNVPVLSWLILRGRCRNCSEPISSRYPALELAMAAVFAVTAATAPRLADLILTLPLAFAFVCLVVIDVEHRRLPDAITGPTFLSGILLAFAAGLVAGDVALFGWALAVAVASFAVFWLIAFVAPSGFGLGDVKLAPSLGLAMGFAERAGARAFIGFLLAFVLGSVVGLVLIAAGRAGRRTKLPFGPFLVAGTFLVLWTGESLVRPWLGP